MALHADRDLQHQEEKKSSKSKTFSLGIRPSFLVGPARLNQALSASFKVIKPGPTSQINQKKQMQILSSYLYPQSCEQFNPSRVLVPEPSHFAQKSSKLGGQGTSNPSSAKHSTDLRLFSPPTRSKQPKLQIHSSAGRIQGAVARTEEKHLARNR